MLYIVSCLILLKHFRICVSRPNVSVYFLSSQSSFKETYMYDFFKSFQEDKCIGKVKKVRLHLFNGWS